MGDLFDDWDDMDSNSDETTEESTELFDPSASDFDEDGLSNEESFQNGEAPSDPKVTRKVAFITIGCGLLLIFVLFLVVGFFNKGNSSKGVESVSTSSTSSLAAGVQSQGQTQSDGSQIQQNPQTQQVQGDQGNNMENSVSQTQPSQVQNQQGVSIEEFAPSEQGSSTSDEGWTEFDEYSGVEWADSTLSSSFTLTSKRNLLRSVGDSAYEMKTVLTGSLSGFNGSFEIEVPYSIGSRLPIGSVINAEVKYGTDSESGKMVVEKVDLV